MGFSTQCAWPEASLEEGPSGAKPPEEVLWSEWQRGTCGKNVGYMLGEDPEESSAARAQ